MLPPNPPTKLLTQLAQFQFHISEPHMCLEKFKQTTILMAIFHVIWVSRQPKCHQRKPFEIAEAVFITGQMPFMMHNQIIASQPISQHCTQFKLGCTKHQVSVWDLVFGQHLLPIMCSAGLVTSNSNELQLLVTLTVSPKSN